MTKFPPSTPTPNPSPQGGGGLLAHRPTKVRNLKKGRYVPATLPLVGRGKGWGYAVLGVKVGYRTSEGRR
jgi:hypothetical protein